MVPLVANKRRDVWVMLLVMVIVATIPFIAGLTRGAIEGKTFLSYRETPKGMSQALFVQYGNVNPLGLVPQSGLSNIGLGSTLLNYVIGIIGWISNTPIPAVFMIGQVFATLFLMIACYALYKALGSQYAEEATLLLMLATGVGWIVHLLLPAKNGLSFWASLFYPQSIYYPLAIGLGILALTYLIRNQNVIAAILLGASIIVHPQLGLINVGISILYLLLNRRKLWSFVIVGCSLIALTVPLSLFYHGMAYGIIKPYTLQSSISYVMMHLLSYGPLLVLATLGVFHRVFIKKGSMILDFVILWVIVFFIIGISPGPKWAVMRPEYFLLVMSIPLAFLASEGVSFFSNRIHIGRTVLTIAVILICLPSTYSLFVMNDGANLVDRATLDAFGSLTQKPMGMVFLPIDASSYGPLLTHKRVAATPESNQSNQQYQTLISTQDPAIAHNIISQWSINYVISPRPIHMDGLLLTYSNEQWYVYSTELPPLVSQ